MKRGKILSIVTSVLLLGGLVTPVAAASDHITVNVSGEVAVCSASFNTWSSCKAQKNRVPSTAGLRVMFKMGKHAKSGEFGWFGDAEVPVDSQGRQVGSDLGWIIGPGHFPDSEGIDSQLPHDWEAGELKVGTYSFRVKGYTREVYPNGISGPIYDLVTRSVSVKFTVYKPGTTKPSNPVSAGWVQSGGRWWYRNADGTYPRATWKQIGAAWYYFDSAGWMTTGWQSIGGRWYYMDPSSGAMTTGWQRIGSAWYYMAPSGAMTTGWQKVGASWYYMAPSGAMTTGWQKIGRHWYYMYSSGVMAANTWIGGYYLTASGAMR